MTPELPIDLGDGLVLRGGTAEDAESLAEFNVRIHSDDPANPDQFLGYWTRDLLSGNHPTTCPQDFTVVEAVALVNEEPKQKAGQSPKRFKL